MIAHDATLEFTEADFRVRAARGLLPAPADRLFDLRTGQALGRSDWDLNKELAADLAAMDPARPAAVLVPIVLRTELTVLLTQRTDTLSSHAGQIAFPGGRIDGTDADAKAAAAPPGPRTAGWFPRRRANRSTRDSNRPRSPALVWRHCARTCGRPWP